MAANPLDLDTGGSIRHHDVGRNATLLGCERYCLGVIPTRMCADAALGFLTEERYCIARPNGTPTFLSLLSAVRTVTSGSNCEPLVSQRSPD